MSPILPKVTAKDVVRVAVRVGFMLDEESGGDASFYRDSDGRRVVVPMDPGRDIDEKALLAIIAEMGLEPEQFRELL